MRSSEKTHCSECGRKLRDSGRGGFGWHDMWLGHSRTCLRYGHPPDRHKEPLYTLLIEGKVVKKHLTREEADALVKTARRFRGEGSVDSGVRIDTKRED